MKFDIKHKKNQNLHNYKKSDLDLAYDFSKKMYKEFDRFLRAIVLFGSTAKQKGNNKTPNHDIDVLVVVDDVTTVLTPEMVETYKIITTKIAGIVSSKLHITTLKFTAFWEYIRAGDPVAINILRDGVPILDTGFFSPMQVLLYQGRIRPTKEAIFNYFSKAPRTLSNARWHIMSGVIDLYWAAIDAAHAALMTSGEIPPSPEHVSEALDRVFVKPKIISKKYATIINDLYKIAKMIMHREVKDINGDHFERYYHEASDFIDEMKKIVDKYEEGLKK